MGIYEHLDYRAVIKEEIESRKKFNSKINYSNLADYIGVQKTLITKVCNGVANFNSDQMFQTAIFLGMNDKEIDYLLLLLEFDRCEIPVRKRLLKEKIQGLRKQERAPEKVLKAESIQPKAAEVDLFYLDPLAQLVHAFLIVPKYLAQPKEIQKILNVDSTRFEEILKLIEGSGFIHRSSKGGIRLLKTHTNLSSSSPIHPTYQHLARARSLDRLLQLSPAKKYSFSVLLSTDEEALNQLRGAFAKFLQTAEKIVIGSTPTTVAQLNFDLFPWE